MNKKIIVIGAGYVGLSVSTLLSQKNDVVLVDILKDRVDSINKRINPLADECISKFFNEKKLNLTAKLDASKEYSNADYIVIACPTNYDEKRKCFDTTIVENIIKNILKNTRNVPIVIKSTIPVGFTSEISNKYKFLNLLFSPEFLRETHALEDCLYPSRIIVGGQNKEKAKVFANLLKDCSLNKNAPILIMNSDEAEAVKLFANSYLASRVAYFNELDSFAELKGLDSKSIIEGVCSDPRIGNFYNNPSFGYGGYCLPKDSKQLLANFENIPQTLIGSIIQSNNTRINFVANSIMDKIKNIKSPIVGIYRLTMKSQSDNFRESSVQKVMSILKENNIKILIYEPTLKANIYEGYDVLNKIDEFKKESSLIVANRFNKELSDVIKKVYTRDIFKRD